MINKCPFKKLKQYFSVQEIKHYFSVQKIKQYFSVQEIKPENTLFSTLNNLFHRWESGYYLESPPYQFELDELQIRYLYGDISEAQYLLKKHNLNYKRDQYLEENLQKARLNNGFNFNYY